MQFPARESAKQAHRATPFVAELLGSYPSRSMQWKTTQCITNIIPRVDWLRNELYNPRQRMGNIDF
jgi:hypothetical protein